jgi:hypothetical protein
MFLELDTPDKGLYADKLKALTGKSRNYWSRVPLKFLKQIYSREIQRKREMFHGLRFRMHSE